MTTIAGFGAASSALLGRWTANFNKLDTNADGSVSAFEAKSAEKEMPSGDSTKLQKLSAAMFKKADTNDDHSVSSDELSALNSAVSSQVDATMLKYQEWSDAHAPQRSDATVFAATDTDKSGGISTDELAAQLENIRPNAGDESDVASKMVAKYDTDGSGDLSLDETSALRSGISSGITSQLTNYATAMAIKNYGNDVPPPDSGAVDVAA